MCSAPVVKQVVNTTARVVSGALTLGASEIIPKKTVVGKLLSAPGNIVTGGGGTASGGIIPAAAVGLGLVKPEVPNLPPPPEPPAAPSPTDIGGEAPPTPGAPMPGTTTVDSLASKRKKRLSLLQQGLLSTIATSGAGLTNSANILTPVAGGSTGKTLLGQ